MAGLYNGSILPLTDNNAATVAIVDSNGDQLPGIGSLPVSFVSNSPANATLSTHTYSTLTSATLLAVNTARHQFIVYNNSNKTVYLAYAASASATAYSIPVPNGTLYESVLNSYTGIITFIWASAPSAGGNLLVTEVTT